MTRLAQRILEHLRTTPGNCETACGAAERFGVSPWRARCAFLRLEAQGLVESASYGPYADILPLRVVLWSLS